jgi:hypothetical protein
MLLTQGQNAIVDDDARGQKAFTVNFYFDKKRGQALRGVHVGNRKYPLKQTLAQFILGITPGAVSSTFRIKYKNGNKLDCRKENLYQSFGIKSPYKQKTVFDGRSKDVISNDQIQTLKNEIINSQSIIKRLTTTFISITRKCALDSGTVEATIANLNQILVESDTIITKLKF